MNAAAFHVRKRQRTYEKENCVVKKINFGTAPTSNEVVVAPSSKVAYTSFDVANPSQYILTSASIASNALVAASLRGKSSTTKKLNVELGEAEIVILKQAFSSAVAISNVAVLYAVLIHCTAAIERSSHHPQRALIISELTRINHSRSHNEFITLEGFTELLWKKTCLSPPRQTDLPALLKAPVRDILPVEEFRRLLERMVPSHFGGPAGPTKPSAPLSEVRRTEREPAASALSGAASGIMDLTGDDDDEDDHRAAATHRRRRALPPLDFAAVERIHARMHDHAAHDALARLVAPDAPWAPDGPVSGEREKKATLVRHRREALSNVELARVKQELYGAGDDKDVVVNKFNVELIREKLLCLKPGTWLNDEIINFTMSMLQERDDILCKSNSERLGCHFFNSFFIDRLGGTGRGYNYMNVRRWSRKFDVFALDKIFCPVNLHNTHWTLLVIYMQRREAVYYDSMSGSGREQLDHVKQWLTDEHKDKKKADYDISDWKFYSADQTTTPQQRNGFDCGVFTCMNADFISDDLDLAFSQDDMPMFREKIAANVLRGSLPYPV